LTAIELGRVFGDSEVASLYRHRPPYPPAVFEILGRVVVGPRIVLDAGAGTGALARGMLGFAARVDAVDPSAAMIAEGQRLPGGDDPRIHWLLGRAEDARLDPPYGLITCGASLHWMEHDVVLPRFRVMLASGARVAIVDTENIHPSTALREEVLSVIRAYSPIKDHISTREMLDGLVERGAFQVEGMEAVPPMPFEQSVDEYMGLLGSTSTLSRTTLGARAPQFEREMRAVFARHAIDRVRYDVAGGVAWGRPIP
jgi:SAM-dependent methyltransferase